MAPPNERETVRALAIRTLAKASGVNSGRHRNQGATQVAQRTAHVPHLLGRPQEHDDHKRVPPQILFRMHYHRAAIRKQRMPNLQKGKIMPFFTFCLFVSKI